MKKGFKFYTWANYGNFGDDVVKQIALKKGFKEDNFSNRILITGGTLLPVHPNQILYKRTIQGNVEDVVVYGAGCIDPAKPEELEFTKEFLKHCKHIGLRDEGSKKVLGMGQVIGDPMFHMDYNNYEKVKENYVVLNIGFNAGEIFGGTMAQLNYFMEILKFTKKVVIEELGLKVYPLMLHNIDEPAQRLILNYFDAKDIVSKTTLGPVDIIGKAQFAITYKQHAMITALCTNTPVMPIAYGQKVINVANEFGIETVRTDEVTEESLQKLYNNMQNWPYERIKAKKQEYKEKFEKFISEVKL